MLALFPKHKRGNRVKRLYLMCLIILQLNTCIAYQPNEEAFMSASQSLFTQTASSAVPNNPKGISFSERSDVETKTDVLAKSSANNPYLASLPLMASAGLGDEKRYAQAREQMLEALNKDLKDYPQEWMQNNSFKAWMLGRVLLAAKQMDDLKTVESAQNNLSKLLEEKITEKDNDAFFVWAWGYRAALNKKEYEIANKKMMEGAIKLTHKFIQKPSDHSLLSDALWAWTMNLAAAANANDEATYKKIKEFILALTDKKSVADALESGLLRTEKSNDYPAWALAKVRLAAGIMQDKVLYKDTNEILSNSTQAARKAENAAAEYVLATIDAQLAVLAGKELQNSKSVTIHG